jgi:hypothetical protein
MGITRSKAIRFLIELGLANNILGDHLKVIIAAVRDATASELSKGLRRVDGNTARSAYFSAQCRHILTNTLPLLGLTEKEMEELIKESEERANTLLTTVPPQLKRLVEAIKAAQEEQDEEERRK